MRFLTLSLVIRNIFQNISSPLLGIRAVLECRSVSLSQDSHFSEQLRDTLFAHLLRSLYEKPPLENTLEREPRV